MGLKDAIPDPAGIMPWVPGETFCETPVRAFTIFIPKPYVGFGILPCCAGGSRTLPSTVIT